MADQESLTSKTKKGLYWSLAGDLANQGMSFIFSIILARLLTSTVLANKEV